MEVDGKMEDFNGDSHQLRQAAPNNTAIAAATETRLKKFELVDKEMSDSIASGTAATSNKKNTILTIPTEILEKIALFLEPKDLLNFRLANKELAERSFDAFAGEFLNTLYWRFRSPWALEQRISELKLSPKFGPAVKHLIVFLLCVFRKGLNGDLADGAGMFRNLRSLTLNGCYEIYEVDTSVKFPQLERLIFVDFPRFDGQSAVALIKAHTASLNSVLFKKLNLCSYGSEEKTSWPRFLGAVRALRAEVLLEVSAPSIHRPGINGVSFSPPPKDFDPERDPLDVFIGVKHGVGGLHYSTKPGRLSVSIDFMIRNYKVLETVEEAMRYGGAFGYCICNSSEDGEQG
ncbi:hypothetical protein EG327_002521 [Venturia inaequalis]|uniref:F-box domain-containing protein n=1 Tax=Venturia inaequalis TaxID=5025 RepID=A0A8H3VU82_VENIN|nr:hypothetical protein EG327_002521 [Venturia inaequalis]